MTRANWSPWHRKLKRALETKTLLVIHQAYLIPNAFDTMAEKKKINTTKDDYDKTLVSDDPTKIAASDLENLAKEAMKKFKSL